MVGIRGGTNDQITPCKLKGIIIGSKEELRRKTIGCKRYRIGERFFEGYMWQAKQKKLIGMGEEGR